MSHFANLAPHLHHIEVRENHARFFIASVKVVH